MAGSIRSRPELNRGCSGTLRRIDFAANFTANYVRACNNTCSVKRKRQCCLSKSRREKNAFREEPPAYRLRQFAVKFSVKFNHG